MENGSGYNVNYYLILDGQTKMQVVTKQNTAHIIRVFFRKLRKYARKMRKDDNAEAIHLFRIEIKKLRAFLGLLSLDLNDEDELKLPSRVKKMYKHAGKVRNGQLLYKRMKIAIKTNKQELGAIKKLWKDDIKKIADKRNKLLSDKDFSAAELNFKKKLPNETRADTVKTFFNLKLETILSVPRKESYSDEELHTIRKSLRDISSIIKLFHSEMKAELPFLFWNKQQEKAAEQLAYGLGRYNDLCTDLSFLKRAMKENNDNGKKEMQYLRNIWLAEKRKLKKEILNSGAIPELFKLKAVSKKDNNCIAGNCFYKSCFIL